MIDINQLTDPAIMALMIGLAIQLLKSCKNWEDEPLIPVQALPYLAVTFGLILSALVGLSRSDIATLADLLSYVIGGFLAALIAIGGYEVSLDKFKRRG